MGRKKTRTEEDIRQYSKDYYYKHKDECGHEYSLVSNRSRLRKKLKALCPSGEVSLDDDKLYNQIIKINRQINAITQELDTIRNARWEAKREAGGARFKRFTSNDTINESTANIE